MKETSGSRPRQPKLRSSCDECGAAKLKCDRGQPECGRCRSLGLACVYGVSRKMGKPPRKRPRGSDVSTVRTAPTGSLGRYEEEGRYGPSNSNDGELGEDLVDAGPASHHLLADDAMDGYPAPQYPLGAVDPQHLLFGDMFEPLLPELASLGFGEDGTLQAPDLPPLESLELGSYSAPGAVPASSTMHERGPPPGSEGHDCFRAAHDILSGLYFQSGLGAAAASPTTPASGWSASGGGEGSVVPLDRVLRLNRAASEKLGRLLNSPCARSPHLALLYASIISRILMGYQQAAGCMPSAACSPTAVPLDAPPPLPPYGTSVPSSGADQRSGSSSTTRSSTVASTTFSCSTATEASSSSLGHAHSTGMSVAPSKIVVGTFDVDDQRVQAALKFQLLAGEMVRVGRLIDQFTSSLAAGRGLTDEHAFGSDRGLFQSLYSWLRSEHLRLSTMLKSKLREVDS